MTHATNPTGILPPDVTLDRLIDTHGAWKTLRALAAALWRRRANRPSAVHLSDHLRRDIGMPERSLPPPPLRGPLL